MNDCRLTIEMIDGNALIKTEGTGILELLTMCGALEQSIGLTAVRGGVSLEDVKSNMLDIHLGAMEALTEQVIREEGNQNDAG